MAGPNVELTRWGFGGGAARFFSMLDEDVELDGRGHVQLPGASLTGRGREAVERYGLEYWRTWADYTAEPRDFVEIGDEVLVEVHERGLGRGSGVPFEQVHFQIWTFRDERVVRWRLFIDRDAAYAAAGLS